MYNFSRRFLAGEGQAELTSQLESQLLRPSQNLPSTDSSKAKVRFSG